MVTSELSSAQAFLVFPPSQPVASQCPSRATSPCPRQSSPCLSRWLKDENLSCLTSRLFKVTLVLSPFKVLLIASPLQKEETHKESQSNAP